MNEEIIDDIFEDIRQTCDDCQHPGCASTVKSAKSRVQSMTDRAENKAILAELEELDEYDAYALKDELQARIKEIRQALKA